MIFAEALVITALLIGFAIGGVYEHARRGGTADLARHLARARHELDQRRLASIERFAPVVPLVRRPR